MHGPMCGCMQSPEGNPPLPHTLSPLSQGCRVLQVTLPGRAALGHLHGGQGTANSASGCPSSELSCLQGKCQGEHQVLLGPPHRQGTRLLSDTCPANMVTHAAFCPETKRFSDSSKSTRLRMVELLTQATPQLTLPFPTCIWNLGVSVSYSCCNR